MSVFDLIVFVVLIALVLRGIWKGMVSQLVSVGSLVVCWIVASRFAFALAPSIPAEPPWNKIGAMVVLFVVTMMAIRFVHGFLEKKLKDWGLSGLNKYLGGGLGLLKGLLVCMVLTFFGVMLSEATRQMVFQSKTGGRLADMIVRSGAFIPADSCELLRAQIDLFRSKIGETDGRVAESMAEPEKGSDDYMQMMLAAKDNDDAANSDASKSAKFGQLLSRSNAVVGEIQALHEDIRQETAGAASLMDALKKWWNGNGGNSNEGGKVVEETHAAVLPSPSIPTVSAAIASPRTEKTAQSAPPTYKPPTAEELAELLPKTEQVTADRIAAETMSIPQPSSPFRLRRDTQDPARSSERLLRSAQSAGSDAPAAVFSK